MIFWCNPSNIYGLAQTCGKYHWKSWRWTVRYCVARTQQSVYSCSKIKSLALFGWLQIRVQVVWCNSAWNDHQFWVKWVWHSLISLLTPSFFSTAKHCLTGFHNTSPSRFQIQLKFASLAWQIFYICFVEAFTYKYTAAYRAHDIKNRIFIFILDKPDCSRPQKNIKKDKRDDEE